jgi:hypothetical protein
MDVVEIFLLVGIAGVDRWVLPDSYYLLLQVVEGPDSRNHRQKSPPKEKIKWHHHHQRRSNSVSHFLSIPAAVPEHWGNEPFPCSSKNIPRIWPTVLKTKKKIQKSERLVHRAKRAITAQGQEVLIT